MNGNNQCIFSLKGWSACKKKVYGASRRDRQDKSIHDNTFWSSFPFNHFLPTLSTCPLRSRTSSRTARFSMVLSLPSPTCMPTLLVIEKLVNVNLPKDKQPPKLSIYCHRLSKTPCLFLPNRSPLRWLDLWREWVGPGSSSSSWNCRAPWNVRARLSYPCCPTVLFDTLSFAQGEMGHSCHCKSSKRIKWMIR